MWLLHVLLKILTWKEKAETGLTLLTMTRSFPSTRCLFSLNELWWDRLSDELLSGLQLIGMLRREAGPCLFGAPTGSLAGGQDLGSCLHGNPSASSGLSANYHHASASSARTERNWGLLLQVQTAWQNWKCWEKERRGADENLKWFLFKGNCSQQ